MTTARDTHNQIEYAKETGLEEGLEEGLSKGRVIGRAEGLEDGHEKERKAIAINLIQLGTPCEIVAKATELSMEEVAKLKEEVE